MPRPRITDEMSWEETREVIKKFAIEKEAVYRDFKKQYNTKKGNERIKLILDYTFFNTVEQLSYVAEYDLMSDFLRPVGEDGKLDQEESRKRMREMAAFMHEEIYKPFIEYVKQNPNHSDEWYQEHFPMDTDAGKNWVLLQPVLSETIYKDFNEGQEWNKIGSDRFSSEPGMLGVFENEVANYLDSLTDPLEKHYAAYATRTIKPLKKEVLAVMRSPRTYGIYKKQQKALKNQEKQQALQNGAEAKKDNKQSKSRVQDWMEFGQKLDTSFITNDELKNEYQKRVTKEFKEFKELINVSGLEDMDDNPAMAEMKENADKAKNLNFEPVITFSGKKTEDILKAFDDIKEIKVDKFNGYPPEENAAKSEDTNKLDTFINNLLDLKSSARLSMEMDDQNLYNSVITELKKAQDPTALHEYLRKRTMESLAQANGNLVLPEKEWYAHNSKYNPAVDKAIDYYDLYKDITGEVLRKKYQEDAKTQIRSGLKDAMQSLTSKENYLTPFAKTLQALQEAGKNGKDKVANELLKENRPLFNSSMLAPYMEGTKIINNKIRQNDEKIKRELENRDNSIKEAEAEFNNAENNMFIVCNNLKLFVDEMSDTASRKDSAAYKEMVKAIDALRPEKKSGFYETLRKMPADELNKKMKYAAEKVDDYIKHAAGKKWYYMLPGSTGSIRYEAAMGIMRQLQNIPLCRKEYDRTLENCDSLKNDLEKAEKQLKEDKNPGVRTPLSQHEIDQMIKPKAKEAPISRRQSKSNAVEKASEKAPASKTEKAPEMN